MLIVNSVAEYSDVVILIFYYFPLDVLRLEISLLYTVLQTDTGGLVEYTKTNGRTMLKELGKLLLKLREKDGCSMSRLR